MAVKNCFFKRTSARNTIIGDEGFQANFTFVSHNASELWVDGQLLKIKVFFLIKSQTIVLVLFFVHIIEN